MPKPRRSSPQRLGCVLLGGALLASLPLSFARAQPPSGPAPVPGADVPRAFADTAAGGRIVVETNDNESSVYVDAAGNLSAALSATDQVRDAMDDVRLYAYGTAASAGVLSVEIELANGSADVIGFPGGVRALLSVAKDGVGWKTVEAADPEVTALAPGASLTLHATVPGSKGPAWYGFGLSVETLRP